MPRKQNRRYGSSVNRSVIEQYDMDSTWAQWRRGVEYFFQGAYLDYEDADATLYQGTDFEIPVTFDGYRFATKNADSRTHYAIRRVIDNNRVLGFVDSIYNDPLEYKDNFDNGEVWVKMLAGRDLTSDEMTVRSIGERITDGIASANIKNVLKSNDSHPAIYLGKSPAGGNTLTVRMPLSAFAGSQYIIDNGYNYESLVGQALYIPEFYRTRPISLFDVFNDFEELFTVTVTEVLAGSEVQVVQNNTTLPLTLGNINEAPQIASSTNTTGGINGAFGFRKSDYQRFFGKQYLTADVVRTEVDRIAYAIPPITINSILINDAAGTIALTTIPFQASLQLLTPVASERILVLDDQSFTIQNEDTVDGVYQHAAPIPGEALWQKLKIGVDPWQDQTFVTGRSINFAELYTCSCPAFLHAQIRSPEVYNSEGKKLNRQTRAPLPTALGASTYEIAGINQAAGIANSWATERYKRSFKICKHTIAAMFINKLRVEEPNTFPSVESRRKFEAKIQKDVAEVAEEFLSQLERSEITTVEIVYALAEALNLDDIEVCYVLMNSNY